MPLIDLLPDYYEKSMESTDYQEVLDCHAEALKTAKSNFFEQLFVKSASWGLANWEKMLGVTIDASASVEFRRERILAKLRGIGTTTKQMIIDTASAFSNGEVEVIEDPANNSFIIRFVGTLGIPGNMADLILTIEEIKPAHLSYTFEYIYRTHAELEAYTHEQLATYTHLQLREEALA